MSLARRLVDVVTELGATDTQVLLERLCRGAVELLDALGSGYCLLDGVDLEVVAVWQLPADIVGERFPVASSAIGALIDAGARSLHAPAVDYPALNAEVWGGVPGTLAVALTHAAGRPSGGLYIALPADTVLSDEQLEVLELLAAHAGVALHDAVRIAAGDQALRQTEEAKDLFLAVAGHELRTPLTVLRGFGETLLHRWDDLADAERRELISTIVARTVGMTALVEQLMLGSQAGTAALAAEPRPFDIAAEVRRVVVGVAGSSPEHPMTVDAARTVLAFGDPDRVEPVLGQLLENAVKYSPDGGPVHVAVAADSDSGSAVVSVSDRGVGIGAGDLDRVFDRFVRRSPVVPADGHGQDPAVQDRSGQDPRRPPGLGLGLWIARRYVEAQGGSVTASRRDGGGTVVELRLPLADY